MIQMPSAPVPAAHHWGRPADEIEKPRPDIARYGARFHKRLANLVALSSRHADLLESFPAAAVAIVSRPASNRARQEAIRLVAEGAPLACIAHALGLPLWFRKLPPEVLSQPLAKRLPRAMRDPSVGARLLNTMPDASGRPDRWLQAVMEAFSLADEEMAVWLGGQRIFRRRRPPPVPVLAIALYRWYVQHPELPAGHLLPRLCDPHMGLGRTALATRHWLLRVLQDLCSDAANLGNDWCAAHEVDGITFVPLVTTAAIVEEGVAMAHCVASYITYVVHGYSRLYSLRRSGARLATLEVRRHEATGVPRITQIKAKHNATPPAEVFASAEAWLAARNARPCHNFAFQSRHHSTQAFREMVWAPFAARARAPDVDPVPPPDVADILQALRELAAIERH